VKLVKTFGLAALAALALMASLGAGSAFAVETTLCKNGTESPYCSPENRYPELTALKTSSSEVFFETAFGNVNCTESSLNARLSAVSGEPQPLGITAWTLGGCREKTFNSKCTATANGPTYNGSLAWSSHGDGTLSMSSNGSGEPGWHIVCGSIGLDCTYTVPTATVHGAAPPTVTPQTSISGTGASCPGSATTLKATYTASTPTIAFVARAESPPSPTTGLCKASESPCEQSNLYASGTAINGTSTNFVIHGSAPGGEVKCSGASLASHSTALYAEPLPVEVTEFKLTGCKAVEWLNSSCEVSTTAYGSTSLSHIANTVNGSLSGSPTWFINCAGLGAHCTFSIASKATGWTLEGGTAPAVGLEGASLTLSGCTLWGSTATVSATIPLSSPKPVYVTDVVH